jgi:hypothetical protein
MPDISRMPAPKLKLEAYRVDDMREARFLALVRTGRRRG